jgi:hypothetical protein
MAASPMRRFLSRAARGGCCGGLTSRPSPNCRYSEQYPREGLRYLRPGDGPFGAFWLKRDGLLASRRAFSRSTLGVLCRGAARQGAHQRSRASIAVSSGTSKILVVAVVVIDDGRAFGLLRPAGVRTARRPLPAVTPLWIAERAESRLGL